MLATTLITLALTSASFAQTTIYWSGNEDRWGGNGLTPANNDNWSTTPGGTTYSQLQGGQSRHMIYNQNAMVGTSTSVLINRQAVEMLSVTMVGSSPSSGFSLALTTNVGNNFGIKLSGPLTVNGGQHSYVRNGPPWHNPNAAVFTLTADSIWTIANNATLYWAIPFTSNSFGITKEGAGNLLFAGDQYYTGNTAINDGVFGVYGANASLAGNLSFADAAKLRFDSAYTLAVAGNVSFAGTFGVADVVGLDSSVGLGAYTLITGNVDFTNIGNVGQSNAVDLGGGKSAYFEQSSLKLIVVPEPSTLALAGLGIAGLLCFRRRVHN